MTKESTNTELLSLAKSLASKALENNISASELEEIITKARKNAGLKSRIPDKKTCYRMPTEEELAYKEKCDKFFRKHLTSKDFTIDYPYYYSKNVKTPEQENRFFTIFAEIMCAVKMLENDDEKITNQHIQNILWTSSAYTNYTRLHAEISYAVSKLSLIAKMKLDEHKWSGFAFGDVSGHSKRILTTYKNLIG